MQNPKKSLLLGILENHGHKSVIHNIHTSGVYHLLAVVEYIENKSVTKGIKIDYIANFFTAPNPYFVANVNNVRATRSGFFLKG